jgi:hypothetical protein
VALKRFPLPPLLFPLYHSTTAPYPFLHLHVVVPGQTGEAWEPSKKHCSYWISGSIGQQSTFYVPYRVHVCRPSATRGEPLGRTISCLASCSLVFTYVQYNICTLLFPVLQIAQQSPSSRRHHLSQFKHFLTSLITNVTQSRNVQSLRHMGPTAICIAVLHLTARTVRMKQKLTSELI